MRQQHKCGNVTGKIRMTRLQGQDQIEIQNSQTIVSFDKKGGGNWEVWHRLISIEGKPAYEIGNICGTCSFYFERLDGTNQSVNPQETIQKLNDGLINLDREVVKSVFHNHSQWKIQSPFLESLS